MHEYWFSCLPFDGFSNLNIHLSYHASRIETLRIITTFHIIASLRFRPPSIRSEHSNSIWSSEVFHHRVQSQTWQLHLTVSSEQIIITPMSSLYLIKNGLLSHRTIITQTKFIRTHKTLAHVFMTK